MNVNRQPEGIPAGGQWATGSRSETEVSLEDAPIPLSQAIADNGGEPLDLHEFEHGDPVFLIVSATPDEDNPDQVLISGEVPLNFVSGLESAMEGVDEDDRDTWLNDRERVIGQWMKDRYGVAQVGGAEWETATGDFETTLPATAGTDDITGALRDNTKAVDLYNESDPGTFGSPDMWRELGEHLAEYDDQAAQVRARIREAVSGEAADSDFAMPVEDAKKAIDFRERGRVIDARQVTHEVRELISASDGKEIRIPVGLARELVAD